MKKKLSFLLCLILIFSLTGCSLLEQLTCEHAYEFSSKVDSTCSKAGYEVSKCNKCGREKKTSIPIIPHDFTSSVVEPTCSSGGYTLNVCKVCGEEKKTNKVDPLPHNYQTTVVEPTCTTGGYSENVCTTCGHKSEDNQVEALGHTFSEWEITSEPTDVKDGVKQRKCLVCGHTEKEQILSKSYIDLTYVKESFDGSVTHDCNNFAELSHVFNLAVVNLSTTLTCNVYEIENFNTLLDDLVKNCDAPYDYRVSANLSGNVLTINFTYNNEPTLKTNNIAYTQYQSFNYNPIVKTRGDNYDDFKINNSSYTFYVSTTDQLHYALERGAKPIIKEGSNAEVVYEKAKSVLREIISDDMTDVQKVKAIHDWLVMNVVYDDDLLKLLYGGSTNLKKYNGFYLEGVFLDNKAVCEGISKAFTVMCNIEGIPCVSVEGIQTGNPDGAGHAWNKVYVDGKWYIADATSDGTIIGGEFEVLSYKYFLISEEEFKVKYTGTNRTNIICNSTYDIYTNMSFTYNEANHDYVISSQEELNNLIAYVYSNTNTNITVEFKLAFDYGNEVTDEISKAYKANNISAKYSYVDNKNLFMLIKK